MERAFNSVLHKLTQVKLSTGSSFDIGDKVFKYISTYIFMLT